VADGGPFLTGSTALPGFMVSDRDSPALQRVVGKSTHRRKWRGRISYRQKQARAADIATCDEAAPTFDSARRHWQNRYIAAVHEALACFIFRFVR
jgi:hypothetical protein